MYKTRYNLAKLWAKTNLKSSRWFKNGIEITRVYSWEKDRRHCRTEAQCLWSQGIGGSGSIRLLLRTVEQLSLLSHKISRNSVLSTKSAEKPTWVIWRWYITGILYVVPWRTCSPRDTIIWRSRKWHISSTVTLWTSFDVGSAAAAARAKSSTVFYVGSANYDSAFLACYRPSHLSQYRPHIGTFQTSPCYVSSLATCTDIRIQRWLVWWPTGPEERQQWFWLWPGKQPSCHIYLRRPNLSRRSAPFIPSGSTDRMTDDGRRGRL